jgi:hypothetical protein
MTGVTLVDASRELLYTGGPAPDHLAARIVADQPGQGWSLLCNGVIEFDDGGELLPDGRAVTPDRRALPYPVAIAA